MKKTLPILIIYLLFNQISILAQDTLWLKNDSLLCTTGPKVSFKGDTTIIINGKNEIIEGILLKNTYLWTGRRLILFRENSKVKFNDKGNVISGYLAEITPLWTLRQNLIIRSNSYVEFSDEGMLLQGELLRNTELPVNGHGIEFERAYPVFFNYEGRLVGGTLAKREQFTGADGKTKNYKPGTAVFFNEKSEVTWSKEQDLRED